MGNGNRQQTDSTVELTRLTKAFTIALVGLLTAAAIVFGLLFAGVRDAKDITSIVGLFTGTLGTIVGAFFGLQVGSAGKEKADQRADKAQKQVAALGEAADPGFVEKVKKSHPELWT